MPKLEQITSLLNTSLQAGVLKGHLFQQGKFYGLVTTFLRGDNEQAAPVIVSLDGETEDACMDDTYPFQLYHRVTGVSYSDGVTGRNNKVAKYSMTAVVYANRKRLRISESDLSYMIITDMEKGLTSTEIGSSGVSSVSASFNSANFDSEQVFNIEYKAKGYPQDPEKIYFAMNYTLSVEASATCVECNDCD